MPKAIATGLNASFPISLTRQSVDYWPLCIANLWFGTHRDNFSHLYQVLREERGGTKVWLVPEGRLETLRRDAVWEAYRLGIPRANIRIVKAEQMFETAALPR